MLVNIEFVCKAYLYEREIKMSNNNNSFWDPEKMFFRNNRMTISLEASINHYDNFDAFEKHFSEELLNEDTRVGDYLMELLIKYDKKASDVSFKAYLAHSYVGNIINHKKNNPSRDALICICFAIGTTEEELQYLLKYAGHAPLYVRKKRDVIIWFGIKKGESLRTVNENLKNRGMKPLYNKE